VQGEAAAPAAAFVGYVPFAVCDGVRTTGGWVENRCDFFTIRAGPAAAGGVMRETERLGH
jgi:hypothetical protein